MTHAECIQKPDPEVIKASIAVLRYMKEKAASFRPDVDGDKSPLLLNYLKAAGNVTSPPNCVLK